jgi:hypothetical protein
MLWKSTSCQSVRFVQWVLTTSLSSKDKNNKRGV